MALVEIVLIQISATGSYLRSWMKWLPMASKSPLPSLDSGVFTALNSSPVLQCDQHCRSRNMK